MRAPAPSAPRDLRAFFALGVSFAAATRDERRVVEITRCAAAAVADDGRIFVAVPLPEGRRTLANVDATGVIALSAALPTDYSTVQLKGCDARRVSWAELGRATADHRARFEAMMQSIGLTAVHGGTMWSDTYEAIVFTPSAVFDQTPGPSAGLAYRP